jgi:hypothetical protein
MAVEPLPDELRGFFRIAHADNNETTHTSALSLLRPVMVNDETNFRVDAGPSLQQIPQALYGGLWSYGHLLMLVSKHFEVDGHDRIALLVEQSKAALSMIPEGARPGRNDPCPCGSGKKFKWCHGR